MKSPIACQHHRNSRPAWNQVRYFAQGLQKTAPASLLLLAIALLSSSSQAQTVRFKSSQTTVSVPLNFSVSPSLTNLVSVSGLNSNVTLSISGAPAGLTPTLSASSIAANTTITITLNCTNVAGGLYPLSLNGTDGATNTWPFL